MAGADRGEPVGAPGHGRARVRGRVPGGDPGEAAVTAFGALAVANGTPPLFAVILVAGAAAFCGDLCCYLVGRAVGVERWAWMRGPRVRAALEWARARLERNAAVVLFTARFVPFARLAVNLAAGAAR